MSERPGFQQLQYEFAAHIRDPQNNPAPPGIEDRRLAIYRELFFNNVAGLLSNSFPVLHQVLSAERWQSLMRGYFAHHEAHTPLFLEMPQEFLAYLQEEHEPRDGDPPFMLELAHYEWAELAVAVLEDVASLDDVDPDGDLVDGIPVISPTAWPLSYQWPVHRISATHQPERPGEEPTFLIVYRDLANEVGFIETNAVTARLLELLERGDAPTGRAVLEQVAAEIGHPDPGVVVDGGREILERLQRHDVVLGVRRMPAED